jgi:hypothetical protein
MICFYKLPGPGAAILSRGDFSGTRFWEARALSFDFHNVKFHYITSIYLLLDTKLFLVHIKIIYGFFRVLIFN